MIFQSKSDARSHFRALRANLGKENRLFAEKRICEYISALPEFLAAKTVLLYMPIHTELNLLPLFGIARDMGKQIAFPISDIKSRLMRFCVVSDIGSMQAGAFGISEPQGDSPLADIGKDTLCIVPALAVDCGGQRLGYGGGFYDRFLSTFEGTSVCAVPSDCLAQRGAFLCDIHDIPINIIITEKGVSTACPNSRF